MPQIGQPFNPYGLFRNISIPRGIAHRTDLSPLAKLLYGALNAHCGQDGNVYPSQKLLGEELGYAEKTIQKGLKELSDMGLIRIVNPTGKDRLLHRRNHYVFLWDGSLDESCKMESPDPSDQGGPCPADRRGATKTGVLKQLRPKTSRDVVAGALLPMVNGERNQSSIPQVAVPPNSGRFQRTFEKLYQQKYDRLYPFAGAKDGAAFKKLFSIFKQDRAEFKRAVIRYLANEEPFHHGHPITKMLLNVQQFMVAHPDDDDGVDTSRCTSRQMTATEQAAFDADPSQWPAYMRD